MLHFDNLRGTLFIPDAHLAIKSGTDKLSYRCLDEQISHLMQRLNAL